MLDTKSHIETPEGVRLPISIASICPRAFAYAIDLFIRMMALAAIAMLLSYAGKLGSGLMLLVAFTQEWFYPVLFDVFNQGATPGKKIMHLHVVHDDGSPVSFSSSLLRNLLMVVDFLPVFYCLGVVVSVCHPQSKRLGDIAAGTLVVYRNWVKTKHSLDASLGKRPVLSGLSLSEQRSIVSFAERCTSLSLARQIELADVLALFIQTPPAAIQTPPADSLTPPADSLSPPAKEQGPLLALKQMANQIAGTTQNPHQLPQQKGRL